MKITSAYLWIVFYVLAIVGLETSAMTCFKHALKDWRWFLVGVLFYVGVGALLVQTFKLTGLAFTNALWSGLSVMATTTVGVLYFKEMLHLHDYLAIGMIGGGVMILKFTD
jgi:multidrug transporter EmrE-like cation transporter